MCLQIRCDLFAAQRMGGILALLFIFFQACCKFSLILVSVMLPSNLRRVVYGRCLPIVQAHQRGFTLALFFS